MNNEKSGFCIHCIQAVLVGRTVHFDEVFLPTSADRVLWNEVLSNILEPITGFGQMSSEKLTTG